MLKDRKKLANSIAKKGDMTPFRLKAGRFTLQGYRHIGAPEGRAAIVYIESDGKAWRNYNQPSSNPTPTNPVGLRLAAQDPHTNVIYLARPCQYTGQEQTTACAQRYWTNARFAPEVLKSYIAALNTLRKNSAIQKFHLVGYSGGGAIAALLAATRQDIASLRTVAGNLDHAAINRHHDVAQMPESLNPINHTNWLTHTPQIHYSGADDDIVPEKIARAFVQQLATSQCARHRIIEDADHHNWPRFWGDGLARELPECRS